MSRYYIQLRTRYYKAEFITAWTEILSPSWLQNQNHQVRLRLFTWYHKLKSKLAHGEVFYLFWRIGHWHCVIVGLWYLPTWSLVTALYPTELESTIWSTIHTTDGASPMLNTSFRCDVVDMIQVLAFRPDSRRAVRVRFVWHKRRWSCSMWVSLPLPSWVL